MSRAMKEDKRGGENPPAFLDLISLSHVSPEKKRRDSYREKITARVSGM